MSLTSRIPIAKESDRNSVGVIIARFQVHELHIGQKQLIDSVLERHKTVIILLGVAPILGSKKNPLDYIARSQMIRAAYSEEELQKLNCNLIIDKIPDNRCNFKWSAEVEKRIREIVPRGTVTLYGSRDSFISSYKGTFETMELETNIFISGTEVRRDVCTEIKASPYFRRGVIAGTSNRWDSGLPTVDAAIYKDTGKGTEFLLARKPDEVLHRFVGGFYDPRKDFSYEQTCRREVLEETGLEIADPRYIVSLQINDWRYAGEGDKVITTFFWCKYVFGTPKPQDDIAELQWFSAPELAKDPSSFIIEEHVPLLNILIEKSPLLF